jgi:hypothetical protein
MKNITQLTQLELGIDWAVETLGLKTEIAVSQGKTEEGLINMQIC